MFTFDNNSYSSPHSDMLDVTTFENNKVVGLGLGLGLGLSYISFPLLLPFLSYLSSF